MAHNQLSWFLKTYLLSKRAYPRGSSFSFALIYGAVVFFIARQIYVAPDVSILLNLVRSSFLLASMLACGEAALCFFRKSTDSKLLFVTALFVGVIATCAYLASYIGLPMLFENDELNQGIFVNAVLFALLIKFDQTMDVKLLDT